MKKLILFGDGDTADVMYYYFHNDSEYEVVAFTNNQEHISSTKFNTLPVIQFEEIEKSYSPSDYSMFIAIAYQDMNNLRMKKYAEAKLKGYEIVNFIHPKADVPKNVSIGENTIIMNNVVVLPGAKIGNNVFIWGNAIIGHHSIIGDNCWLSPPTIISGNVAIGKNCFLGANATLGNNITIGDNCFIGANVLQVNSLGNEKVVIAESSNLLDISSQEFSKIFKF